MTITIDLEEYKTLIEKAVRIELALEYVRHESYPRGKQVCMILTGEYPEKEEAD